MSAHERTKTLAAEIFEQTPELRRTADRSDAFTQLSARLRRIDVLGTEYVVLEGDLLYDDDEFRLYALQEAAHRDGALVSPITAFPLEPSPALVGISSGNRVVRWEPGRILGYAISRVSFPDQPRYEEIRDAMLAATAAWEGICGVAFAYSPQFDEEPDPTKAAQDIAPRLVFTVRYVDAGGQFIASAFFPTYPPARRRIFIDPSYFADDLRFDRVGVLRHELGHVLGFRHEHIRSGAPSVCPQEETTDVVDLTAYDPQSVMHYFCGEVGSRDLRITELDRQGAQKLYGPPLNSLRFVV